MNIKPIFNPDTNVDQSNYYWFQEGFLQPEVDQIEELAAGYPEEKATIVGEDSDEVRKSNIKWLHPGPDTEWIYDRLMNCITEANDQIWKFDLKSILDSIQYTVYNGGGGHYHWHMDIGPGDISHRKISAIVQLSNEEDYTGGDFEISTGRGIYLVPKAKGTVALFPSFMLHRVTPVITGTRKSLVLWAGGGHYK
jgi:PKHD-type hydroxylase